MFLQIKCRLILILSKLKTKAIKILIFSPLEEVYHGNLIVIPFETEYL